MRKTLRLSASVVICALVGCLSACQSAPVPQPKSVQAREHIVSDRAYEEIAHSTLDALEAADKDAKADSLTARVGEPARGQRAAQYQLQGLRDGFQPPAYTIGVDAKDAKPVSSGTAFPRSLLSYSAPVEGQNQRTLTAWQQADARSNYKLWGQVVLFPQEDLPELVSTLSDEEGFVQADAGKYVADPSQVAQGYAAYLNERKVGEIKFKEGDAFYKKITEHIDALKQTVGDHGSVALKAAPSDMKPVLVATKDQGIVLMQELVYDIVYTSTDEDQLLTLKDSNEALMYSKDKAKSSVDIAKDQPFTAHYSILLAFHVPAKGGADTVNLIGASTNVLLSASA